MTKKDVSTKKTTKEEKPNLEMSIETKQFKRFLKLALTVREESTLSFNKKQMFVQMTDEAHVRALRIELNKKAFLTYNVKIPKDKESFEMTLDMKAIEEFIGTGSALTTNILFKESDGRLRLEIGNLSRYFALIGQEVGRLEKFPITEGVNAFDMMSNELKDSMKAACTLSSCIDIRVNKEGVSLFSEDGRNDEVEANIGKDDLKNWDYDSDSESKYDLLLLKGITDKMGNNEAIRVFVGSDFPLKLEWDLGDSEGVAQFLIAPRVDVE